MVLLDDVTYQSYMIWADKICKVKVFDDSMLSLDARIEPPGNE